jgi:hypothetical protein
MTDGIAYSLTPEILTAIAKLPLSQTKTGNWLDDTINSADLTVQIKELVVEHFATSENFFVAVAAFLQENNYLPDVSLPESEEESSDFLDLLDSRVV